MNKSVNSWELLHLHGGLYDEDYVAIDSGPVVGSDGLTVYSKGLWEMSAHEYHAAPDRAEANGHLMVAAPELAYLNDQEQHSWKETVELLRVAIGKAESL